MNRNLLRSDIGLRLSKYETDYDSLDGIFNTQARRVFIEQIIDSIHRVEYPKKMLERNISTNRCNPKSEFFNPLLAAICKKQSGEVEEAFWFIFLFTHFGKNHRTGWGLVKSFYGCLDNGNLWSWEKVSLDPVSVEDWILENLDILKSTGGFGNHRKYTSIKQTGKTIASYVDWIGEGKSHIQHIHEVSIRNHESPQSTFHDLYLSMQEKVWGFGRLAIFDYLTMLGKLKLAHISPKIAYIDQSTGPKRGIFKLLDDDSLSQEQINMFLAQIDSYLMIGMQVLEDAICNWQKDTQKYVQYKL